MDYKPFLEISNTVQEALALLAGQVHDNEELQLNLPQIAVVGAQSVGKSSVLESIVGFDFLPRGKGMVTRRPLIIEMKTTKGEGTCIQCLLKDGMKIKKFTDPLDVRVAIEEATKNHPKCANNRVTDEPLVLEIRSDKILTLTLIDLPGMTKCPTKDQPADICLQIETIVRRYIKNENTIILAVTPANADVATSDAVKIAREVDPNFERTVGVLTKIDLMDKGTEYEARELVQGQDKNFPRVWIPVKNRCHAEIYSHASVEDLRQAENDFFEEWFKELNWNEDRCGFGIDFVCRTLEAQFSECLRQKMPLIENDVKRMYKQKLEELQGVKAARDPLLWKVKAITATHDYCRKYERLLTGQDDECSNSEINVGAKIVRLYRSEFLKHIQALDPLADYRDDVLLQTLIENCRGHNNGIFLPNEALKRVVKENVDKILPICQTLVDAVSHELKQQTLLTPVEDINASFGVWVQTRAMQKIDKWAEECSTFVNILVNMEKQISRDHPIHPLRLEDIDLLEDANGVSGVNSMINPTTGYGLSASHHGMLGKKKKKMKAAFKTSSSKKKSTFIDDDASAVSVAVASNGRGDESVAGEIQRSYSGDTTSNTQHHGEEHHRDMMSVIEEARQAERAGSDEDRSTKTASAEGTKETVQPHAHQRGAFMACHGVRDAMLGGHQFEEIQIIRLLLKQYFDNVVRAKIIDSVPKAISYHLVISVQDKLWNSMVEDFYQVEKEGRLERDLMGLTEEDNLVVTRCEDAVNKLEQALEQMQVHRALVAANAYPSR